MIAIGAMSSFICDILMLLCLSPYPCAAVHVKSQLDVPKLNVLFDIGFVLSSR